MESVLGRYRNLIMLVGVLFLQVLGLAMQVKRNSTETHDTRLIRIWAVDLLTPFERSLVWVENGAGNVWHNYFYLRGVRAENRELKDQIEKMRLDQVRLTEDATQARRLQNLLAFKEQFIAKTVAAQVIGSSGSDLSRVVYIDKGENAGIERDMAVMTADGIVGKVLLVYPSVSQVLLINDQSSGVGALLEKSRLQGVLRGSETGEVMLERVMSDEQVTVGETVLTSGGDQIFPKGLPVGTVTKVGAGKDLFLNIKIKPATDLSKLEEVLVLVEKREKQAIAEDKVRVRAADILAQRLPSVPDKPPTIAPSSSTPKASVTGKPLNAGVAKPQGTNPGANAAGVGQLPRIIPTSTATASPGVKKVVTAPGANAEVGPAIVAEPQSSDPAPAVQPATQTTPPNSKPPVQPNSPPADGSSPQ